MKPKYDFPVLVTVLWSSSFDFLALLRLIFFSCFLIFVFFMGLWRLGPFIVDCVLFFFVCFSLFLFVSDASARLLVTVFCSSSFVFLFFYSSVTPRLVYWWLCSVLLRLFFFFFYSSLTPRLVYWWLCSVLLRLFFFFFIRLWRLGSFIGDCVLFFFVCFSCFSLFYLSMALRPIFRPWHSPCRRFDIVDFFVRAEDVSLTPDTTWRANCVFLIPSSFLNPNQLNFFALKALVLGVGRKLCLYSLFKRVLRTAVL